MSISSEELNFNRIFCKIRKYILQYEDIDKTRAPYLWLRQTVFQKQKTFYEGQRKVSRFPGKFICSKD